MLEAKSKTAEDIVETRERKSKTQGPDSPRRKREQSNNSKNKRRQTEETSQQMSDITFSENSTFEKGFNPPTETLQAQASTGKIMTEIENGEEARPDKDK